MGKAELGRILAAHAKWLRGEAGGEKADLSEAWLCGVDLAGADLRGAKLWCANLCGADLGGTRLGGADLRNAVFDFSTWPLWCGTFRLGHTDDRLTAQLVRHTLEVAKADDSDYGRAVVAALKPLDRFHEYRGDVKPFEGGLND